jgi:hypothetical protein
VNLKGLRLSIELVLGVITIALFTGCAAGSASTSAPTSEATTEAESGRPSEPAAPDEYRADPATDVAATGNPQLIEFFAFW